MMPTTVFCFAEPREITRAYTSLGAPRDEYQDRRPIYEQRQAVRSTERDREQTGGEVVDLRGRGIHVLEAYRCVRVLFGRWATTSSQQSCKEPSDGRWFRRELRDR